MKRLILLAIMLGLALTFVIGCSDDDEDAIPTTPTILEQGSLDDADFVAAQEALFGAEDFGDSLFVWMEECMERVESDPDNPANAGKVVPTMAASDPVIITYHDGSQYWYIYIQSVDTIYGQGQTITDILTFVLEDSIRFLHGSTVVQWPDSDLLTRVNNGALMTVTTQSGLGNATAAQNVSVVGEIVARGDVTIDGSLSVNFSVSGPGGACSASLAATATADDIVLNMTEADDGGCAQSGHMAHIGTLALECTGDDTLSYSERWTFDQTFYGDSTLVVVENSTTRWTFTDTCDVSGPVTKPYEDLLAAVRRR